MNIILIGGPGSGKSTYAEFIIKEFGIDHIYPGELLRKAKAQGGEMAKRLSNLGKGEFAPNDIVLKLVKDAVAKADKEFYLYRIDAFSNDGVAAQPGLFRNFSQSSTGQQYTVARTTFYSNMNIQRRIPFKYSEKTDIQFQLRTNSGTHEMNVFGEGILVDVPRTMQIGS